MVICCEFFLKIIGVVVCSLLDFNLFVGIKDILCNMLFWDFLKEGDVIDVIVLFLLIDNL